MQSLVSSECTAFLANLWAKSLLLSSLQFADCSLHGFAVATTYQQGIPPYIQQSSIGGICLSTSSL